MPLLCNTNCPSINQSVNLSVNLIF